jgi:hypothetical protein
LWLITLVKILEIRFMAVLELGLYKHYKGNVYEVVGLAKHSETLEEMVLYKATYQKEGENLWVRPLAMFVETIVVDGNNVKRFTKI